MLAKTSIHISCCLIFFCLSLSTCQAALHIDSLGVFPISTAISNAHELSGLTYAGPVAGSSDTFVFYAVSDALPVVYNLTIRLNIKNGSVISALITSQHQLSSGNDLEGVAFDPLSRTILVSDEVGPHIWKAAVPEWASEQPLPTSEAFTLPPLFSSARNNLSLESLALGTDGSVWTANEEALVGDGEPSNVDHGSVVRLVKFTSNGKMSGQWAYLTDPVEASPPKGDPRERSGVSDVVVMPNGELLVLERELDVRKILFVRLPRFRSRLYEVDFNGGTDVSGFGGLIGADYRPVAKRLLWEKRFLANNFEGACLGPKLADGRQTLLLVSDDEDGLIRQDLQMLLISND